MLAIPQRWLWIGSASMFFIFGAVGTIFAAPEFPRVVHIAARSDGVPGKGTADDPFNGSTQSKFDAIMRKCGSGSDIILGPGTFLTKGNDDGHATDGFFLQPKTRLRGSGKGVTVVKLAALNFAENIHVAICTGAYGKGGGRPVDHDDVTVEDLTVDCNPRGLKLAPPNSNAATYGVQLSGSNATIRNVEVIGAYAMSGPFESFAIGIFAMTKNTDSALIENCTVREANGDYVTAIILGGDRGWTASGRLTGNTVLDTAWVAYSGGGTTNCIFSDNIADRVGFGFRFDTGEFSNVIFSGNAWHARKSAVLLTPQIPAARVGDVLITGNIFSSDEEPVVSLRSLNATPVKGIFIQGNVLRSSRSGNKAGQIERNSASRYSNVTVTGNHTSLPFDFPEVSHVRLSDVPSPPPPENKTKSR
ncbi:MAG: hypothetical protein PHC88_04865 [Terrimicrobiaceae bacterium]|nr:hypothetical protein [Terrimicrobiaceae bacterium]